MATSNTMLIVTHYYMDIINVTFIIIKISAFTGMEAFWLLENQIFKLFECQIKPKLRIMLDRI